MVDQGRGLPVSAASAVATATASYSQYPAPLAKYEDVVANPQLFMTTLEKLHSAMATKFMVPIVGGRDLDLHKLFVEVTSRGGIEKILREKRWKEVTSTFNFPSTATNASFVLRKYYYSLLQHYEQIYYFKSQGWSPAPDGALQSHIAAPVAVPGMSKATTHAQAAFVQQPRVNNFVSGVAAPTVGCPIIGVIDGKFDSGYLVTVTLGNEKMKGVLYQTPPAKMNQVPQTSGVSIPATSGVHRHRRRRRRKSELRKRDPTHPKPNRSGYNFFFSEQHALLKPLHPGKDREISRMIGELWNNLKDNEKAVYQEKAIKDKERYRIEMEDYKERQKENHVIDAVPLKQRFPGLDVEMVEVNVKDGTERNSVGTPENESNSSESDDDDDDDDDGDDDGDDDNMMEKDEEIFSDAQVSPFIGGTTVESSTPTGTSEATTTVTATATETTDFQIAVEAVEKDQCEEGEGSPENVEHENSVNFYSSI